MVILSRIYTRTGDTGITALGDFSRTSKNDPRLVTYADTDETGSVIGVAIACGDLRADLVTMLTRVQNELFDVGADLCTPLVSAPKHPPLRVQQVWIDDLESDCNRLNNEVETLQSFILSGGSSGAAHLHLARTVARRAERSAWTALQMYGESHASSDNEPGGVNPLTATYLNRLSDLLFLAARVANLPYGGDVLWQPGGGRELRPDQSANIDESQTD